MMHTLRMIRAFMKVSLQTALAYRVDAIVSGLITLMWLGWELLGLGIIFSNTDSIAGWGPGELITLLGVFRLVNILMFAIIWPATEKFNTGVRDGSLDYTLLQPANSLFVVTFQKIMPLRILNVIIAIVMMSVGIRISGSSVEPLNLVYFLVLAAVGLTVIYSLWVVLIALTFWFVKFDNNVTILQALMDSGRYPATIYPPWLRVLVTYIVPIAAATTIPMQGLRGDLTLTQVLLFVVIGLAAFAIAMQIWKAGVRQYSGASS